MKLVKNIANDFNFGSLTRRIGLVLAGFIALCGVIACMLGVAGNVAWVFTPPSTRVENVLVSSGEDQSESRVEVLAEGKLLPDGTYDFGSDCAAAAEARVVLGAKTRCDKSK